MLVERDRRILRFVETYGGITINQCAKMYFNETNQSYQLARKRLKKIYEMGLLKFYTNKFTNERVYCMDRKLTPHAVYLLNVYATLIESKCKILEFKKEPQWLGETYRSDGLFKIEFNDEKRLILAEIDVLHSTDINKYEDIYGSNEIQKEYGGFPIILVVGDSEVERYSENFDVVYLDYNLHNFIGKVLA